MVKSVLAVASMLISLSVQTHHISRYLDKRISNSLGKQESIIWNQPFFGIAASLVYILAMDWYPLTSPERKRLPVHRQY